MNLIVKSYKNATWIAEFDNVATMPNINDCVEIDAAHPVDGCALYLIVERSINLRSGAVTIYINKD